MNDEIDFLTAEEMARNIQEAMKIVSQNMISLGIVSGQLAQSTNELSAEFTTIKNRYHPIIWFFIKWFVIR